MIISRYTTGPAVFLFFACVFQSAPNPVSLSTIAILASIVVAILSLFQDVKLV